MKKRGVDELPERVRKKLAVAGDEFLKMVQGNASLGEKLMRRLNDVISHRSQFTTVSGVPETEVSVEEA